MMGFGYWCWLAGAAAICWRLAPAKRYGFAAAASILYLVWLHPGETAALLAGSLLAWRVFQDIGARRSKSLWITWIAGLSLLLAAWKFLPTAGAGLTFQQTAAEGLVPLGLSYLVFKLIHAGIEIHRQSIKPPDLATLLAYLFFAPMFSAGPIERLDRFQTSRDLEWSRELWVDSGTRIMHGLIKKFGISEGLLYHWLQARGLDDPKFNLGTVEVHEIWLFVLLSYFKIYMDFSAYSDLALGAGRLLGWRLMENFDWPILAANPSEFWRRWHISLSRWCQDYIYMPSLGIFRSPYIPLFLTFLVMGAWHIVSWNRVGWAAYNALGIIVFMAWSRWMGRPKPGEWRATPLWKGASILITQVFVLGSVAFFMNGEDQTLSRSLEILGRMTGAGFRGEL